ncbi:hypothetical protein DEO72_LG11g1440 [Vigna unguiculata]|uniref:Uncharacterized protein n=1 Tax=Vigna unguiculata TaxID=3917 RepID=A0A4D6NKY4_VIGUN|nr:hypothetical protein DEO72_LG11g1440 [Vigna unguiculata]
MQNSFSYENNQQCDFQVNYDYYPQQPRDSYDYQQQIVTPTSAPDISGLTLRQFNDLYPRSSFLGYEQQPYSECPPQQPYVPNSFQQQYVPPQQVEATNGPSYREVMILMGEVIEKLESMDERLRVDQRCRNIEQEWYENKQILSDMLRDASKNNFIELLVTVNTTPQPHQRFPENPDFNTLRHEIKDVLLKLAIRAEQMSEDLSQLMNDAVRKVTLEDMMKMMTEMMKMDQTDQKEMMNAATQSLQNQSEKPIAESHHIDISTDGYNHFHSNMSTDGHINFAKDVADEEIEDSHTNISTDGYVDDAQCEYKVVPVDEDMSTNDHFQEQSCENNTMEEPSAVEEPTIFEDAAEASTIATDLVNDEAAESTTPGENFCSEDEIMRITDDPLNHLNAPDDAQVELKPHTPHIKFVDVNDANKFSVVIFVDMAAEKEERLLQQENRYLRGFSNRKASSKSYIKRPRESRKDKFRTSEFRNP